MKIRITEESKSERLEPISEDPEALKNPANYKEAIRHRFAARILEPKPRNFEYHDSLYIAAALLPSDTQVGDEFIVYFERAKK